MNKIIITGRLVRDPESKQLSSGTSVCNTAIAVDRTYKDKEGNRQSDFFDVSAFGYTADFISKYFKKGDFIAIAGSMESRKYTDKDGNNRTAWSIHVDEAQFCGGKKSGGDAPAKKPAVDEGFDDMVDEDTPF